VNFLFPSASLVLLLQLQLNLKSASVREEHMVWRRRWCARARARQEEWGREGGREEISLRYPTRSRFLCQARKKNRLAREIKSIFHHILTCTFFYRLVTFFSPLKNYLNFMGFFLKKLAK
jgi:hypothetical protein